MSFAPWDDLLDTHNRPIAAVGQQFDQLYKLLVAVGPHLDDDAKKLVSDAGWQGDAAEAFRGRWEHDYGSLGALCAYIQTSLSVLSDLCKNLGQANRAFGDAIHAATASGVKMGPNYTPIRTQVCGSTAYSADAAGEYAHQYDALHDLVERYRYDAARSLTSMHDAVVGGPGISADQGVTIAGLLADLYTSPGDALTASGNKLGDMVALSSQLHGELKAADKALHSPPGGPKVPAGLKDEVTAADAEITRLEGLQENAAQTLDKLPYAKLLGTDVGDLVGAAGHTLPKGLGFLDDVPLLDVGFAVVAGQMTANEWNGQGENPLYSEVTNMTAQLAGVGVAVAIVAIVGAPEVEVGAGVVLAAGAIGAGVADGLTNVFDEHWDEDWSDNGPLFGTLEGGGHVIANTVGDGVGLVQNVVGAGSDLVGGIGNFLGL